MWTNLHLQSLPLDRIVPDQRQPRRSFDLAQLETLKASLATHGLLHPLLVRCDAPRQLHVIVCGERRWRCAEELGWTELPCRVIDRDVTQAELVTLQLMENLQREDLNPLDEARSLARLQDLLKCSREDLAEQTLRSPASICRSFKLLDLPAEVQSLIEQHRLPVSIAAELHRCTDPTLLRELAEQVAAGQLTRGDVTTRVRQAAAPATTVKPQRLTFSLADGISLHISATTSLVECEAALTTWLRRFRQAKSSMPDLASFVASLRTTDANS